MNAPRLFLLDGFELYEDGRSVNVTAAGRRLLAFLGLHGRNLPRSFVAGNLWPAAPERRAMASLRSALWRLRATGCPLIETVNGDVQISSELSVDFQDAVSLTRRILRTGFLPDPPEVTMLLEAEELLPGWYDEWVLYEKEMFRHLRLQALEAICEGLTRAGRLPEAVEVGLAAVAGEPLRETAQRVLIGAHLAQGNRCEAVRQYASYRRLLRDELGLDPSRDLDRLVSGA
jgi:DNA-binding SARP family transcriptional activator